MASQITIEAQPWATLPHALPPGLRVAVVADIHGEMALMTALETALLAWLEDDPAPPDLFAQAAPVSERWLIRTGDLCDRGEDTRAVLERAQRGLQRPNVREVTLRGNHEWALMDMYLGRNDDAAAWDWIIHWGGVTTLKDFGIALPTGVSPRSLEALRTALADAIPEALRQWLEGLPTLQRLGGLVFVHAGVHPDRPLAQQGPDEFCWIREPFLSTRHWDHDFLVVHGHTIERAPTLRRHRLGLDTGAFMTGRLSGALLMGDQAQVLTAQCRAERRWAGG